LKAGENWAPDSRPRSTIHPS